MEEENLENIDPSETKPKAKRKVLRKVRKRKSKKVDDEDTMTNAEADEQLNSFQVISCELRFSN